MRPCDHPPASGVTGDGRLSARDRCRPPSYRDAAARGSVAATAEYWSRGVAHGGLESFAEFGHAGRSGVRFIVASMPSRRRTCQQAKPAVADVAPRPSACRGEARQSHFDVRAARGEFGIGRFPCVRREAILCPRAVGLAIQLVRPAEHLLELRASGVEARGARGALERNAQRTNRVRAAARSNQRMRQLEVDADMGLLRIGERGAELDSGVRGTLSRLEPQPAHVVVEGLVPVRTQRAVRPHRILEHPQKSGVFCRAARRRLHVVRAKREPEQVLPGERRKRRQRACVGFDGGEEVSGMVSLEMSRMGAYAASQRPSALAASIAF